MTYELAPILFFASFALCCARCVFAVIAYARLIRLLPAWRSAIEATTGDCWLRVAARRHSNGDWAHPGGMILMLALAALFGLSGAVEIIFGGFADTAASWLGASGIKLFFALFDALAMPLGCAIAAYSVGKAAEPSSSPIRAAMDQFETRAKQESIALSERATLEQSLPANDAASARLPSKRL